MCDRQESRPSEAILRTLLKPMSYFFPTAITTPVEVLSRAMINNAVAPTSEKVELYENKAIHQLAGKHSTCKTKESSDTSESQKVK